MTETTDALVRLDRKVSRALSDGRGIRLTGDELELLASIGMIEQLADSKAVALKEQARCRQARVASIKEGRSGLTSFAALTAVPPAIGGISGGTTPAQADNSGEARALRTFG